MLTKRKKKNPVAKELLQGRTFRQKIAEEEKKLNRRLTDGEIIRRYCDELQEKDDADDVDA